MYGCTEDDVGDSDIKAEGGSIMQDRTYLMNLRSVTLAQLAVYEQQLGLSPTTSEKLLWIKRRGPSDKTIAKQVAHIKRCEGKL